MLFGNSIKIVSLDFRQFSIFNIIDGIKNLPNVWFSCRGGKNSKHALPVTIVIFRAAYPRGTAPVSYNLG